MLKKNVRSVNRPGVLLLGLLLGPISCSSLSVTDSSLSSDRVDFGATVAAFPEYRQTGLPVPVIPLTQQRIDQEKDRVRASAQNAPRPATTGSFAYQVGPRDVLAVSVWDHPELSSPERQDATAEANGYLVSEDGTIFYPYIGSVKVADLTIEQIRAKLTELLAAEIQSPQLDVSVAAYRSKTVFIAGEVASPGLQPITDLPLTILDAINNANGFTGDADLSQASLSRKNDTFTLDLNELFLRGDNAQNVQLIDGDVLTIPNAGDSNYYVLGKVKSPTIKKMTSGRKTLAAAIEEAGKVFPVTADKLVHFFIIRSTSEGPLIFHVDGASPDSLILRNNFEVIVKDIVYVVTARPSLWDQVYKQLLQYANVYGTTS